MTKDSDPCGTLIGGWEVVGSPEGDQPSIGNPVGGAIREKVIPVVTFLTPLAEHVSDLKDR